MAVNQTRYRSAGGTLLVLAGAAILMGIITAEALYPAASSHVGASIKEKYALIRDQLVSPLSLIDGRGALSSRQIRKSTGHAQPNGGPELLSAARSPSSHRAV
jgi:hypothetical protein